MLAEKRRQFIIDKLKEEQSVQVNELSNILNVSRETVRRDLEKLQNKNLLKRTHGGAVAINKKEELSFNTRIKQNIEQKEEIAKKALNYVKNGATIFLDISSTALIFARKLNIFSELTIITNSARIVTELADYKQLTVLSTGGLLMSDSISFVGPHANSLVNNYFADIFFASCKGISPTYGATDSSDLEIEIKESMVKRSNQVIILADYSKFIERGLSAFASPDEINTLITDSSVKSEIKENFINSGMEIY